MKEMKIGAVSVVENEAKSLGKGPDFLSEQATAAAHRIHQELPGYQRTPLVRLDAMAKRLGVKAVLVKDESRKNISRKNRQGRRCRLRHRFRCLTTFR